jgi:hypothetical protein
LTSLALVFVEVIAPKTNGIALNGTFSEGKELHTVACRLLCVIRDHVQVGLLVGTYLNAGGPDSRRIRHVTPPCASGADAMPR